MITEQFELLNNQLHLAEQIQVNQPEKLKQEQKLLKNGRTTTFQVLQFEQDLLIAQTQYYNTKNKLLNLNAAVKLFS